MAQINKRNSSISSSLPFACSAHLAHLVQPTLHAGGNLPCTFGATYLARWGQPTLHIWCNLPCTLGAIYLAHLVQPTLHTGGNLLCTFIGCQIGPILQNTRLSRSQQRDIFIEAVVTNCLERRSAIFFPAFCLLCTVGQIYAGQQLLCFLVLTQVRYDDGPGFLIQSFSARQTLIAPDTKPDGFRRTARIALYLKGHGQIGFAGDFLKTGL